MQGNWSRQACARWVVIAVAACFAAVGCQSVTMRGQSDADLVPFPEAEGPQADDSLLAKPPASRRVPTAESAPARTLPPQRTTAPRSAPKLPTAPAAANFQPTASNVTDLPIRGAPSELRKTTMPAYVVEPPDVLLIEAVKMVPKPPYLIEPLDILQITVLGTLLGQDIMGQFAVDPSGMVDLGPAYGRVHIAGLSTEEATSTIQHFLKRVLREPEVSVVLLQTSGQQQIAGEHMIGPDGTINLGTYGSVYVAGMTLSEVRDTIEQHLTKYLQEPQVSVDVFAYQSKNYYVISQGAGLGDGVTRIPITGNETVLDAIAQVNGISRLSSKKIWIARPAPGGVGCDQILPVNYQEITAGAATATNYQILPNDRVFIAENKIILVDSVITKVTAPFERIFGFSLLGAQTIQTMNRFPDGLPGQNSF